MLKYCSYHENVSVAIFQLKHCFSIIIILIKSYITEILTVANFNRHNHHSCAAGKYMQHQAHNLL